MALSRNVAVTVRRMRGQKAAPVKLPTVKGPFVTAPRPGPPSRAQQARARARANLTPGPKYDVMGHYYTRPYTNKVNPDTDEVTPARMPNQRYQGKRWGRATPHQSNVSRRRTGTDWAWGLSDPKSFPSRRGDV